jgi:hypothetical protein
VAVAELVPLAITRQVGSEWFIPFLQLFGTACTIPSVAKIGATLDGTSLDLWVGLSTDAPDDEDALYLAAQRYRADVASLHLDLHVIFPDEEASAFPASVDVMFTRA